MLVYYFLPFTSTIFTLYSKFQVVIKPQPSKIGHMFIKNIFYYKDLGGHLLQ